MQRGVSHIGFVSRGPAQTRRFGEELGAAVTAGDLILLDGPFGAGKTTLVQGLVAALGAGSRVTSPSFTLINEYSGRVPVCHVDLFRLKALDVEMEQALESCLEGDWVTIVEWPDLMPQDLRGASLRIEMAVLGDEDRSLVAHAEGSRWDPERLLSMMESAMRLRDGQGG